jgi:hypothetical protein
MATKRRLPPIDEGAQAARILRQLGEWLTAGAGRAVTVRFTERGWLVVLDEQRQTSGGSITDAMAQAAQVCSFEGAEVRQ